jgi:hypothetical protein
MSHAPAILAAMTSCLADATAAGLPCGVPTHSAAGLAEALSIDTRAAYLGLVDLMATGQVERLPRVDALGYAVYRLVQRVPA